jgi:transcriptional regulator with XRE-family HTH domain
MLAHNQEGKLIMIVRKLRLQRGWSQEQLAHIADLNVRTIQRIERGQAPSLESKKSLAAAFEVQLATFETPAEKVVQTDQSETDMNSQQTELVIEAIKADERYAINYAKGIKEFYEHAVVFAVIASLIVFVKGFDDAYIGWALLGWTVGVVIHGLNAFERINFFNANWERKIAEKKLGRKL